MTKCTLTSISTVLIIFPSSQSRRIASAARGSFAVSRKLQTASININSVTGKGRRNPAPEFSISVCLVSPSRRAGGGLQPLEFETTGLLRRRRSDGTILQRRWSPWKLRPSWKKDGQYHLLAQNASVYSGQVARVGVSACSEGKSATTDRRRRCRVIEFFYLFSYTFLWTDDAASVRRKKFTWVSNKQLILVNLWNMQTTESETDNWLCCFSLLPPLCNK